MQYNNGLNNTMTEKSIEVILSSIENIKKCSVILEESIKETYPLMNRIRTPEEEQRFKELVTKFRFAEWSIRNSTENIKNTYFIPFRYQTIGNETIDIQAKGRK